MPVYHAFGAWPGFMRVARCVAARVVLRVAHSLAAAT